MSYCFTAAIYFPKITIPKSLLIITMNTKLILSLSLQNIDFACFKSKNYKNLNRLILILIKKNDNHFRYICKLFT